MALAIAGIVDQHIDRARLRLELAQGGKAGLEVAQVATPDAMERVLYTPQSVAIEHIAAAYGWTYTPVSTRAALDQALTSPAPGRQIVEVALAR